MVVKGGETVSYARGIPVTFPQIAGEGPSFKEVLGVLKWAYIQSDWAQVLPPPSLIRNAHPPTADIGPWA